MNNFQLSIDGVLFDLDGVLVDSLSVMKLALSAALCEVYPQRELDMERVFAEYKQYLGMGFVQIMQQMGLSENAYEPFRTYSRAHVKNIQMYDGVEDLLAFCQAEKLPVGIATGKDYERTVELLQYLGIEHYFADIFASDTVANTKPAPDMAIKFCQHHALDPEKTLLIGDTRADVQCGNAAGCQTAIARWGYGSDTEFEGLQADYEFMTPQHALKQLTRLICKRH